MFSTAPAEPPPPPPNRPRLFTGIDFESKSLRSREVFKGTEHDLDYDYLVIATGAQNNTFGVPGVNNVSHSKRPTPLAVQLR